MALTSSALLLPAYAGARAESLPEATLVALGYSKYTEDDISTGKAFGGRSERMEVDIAQFHLFAPLNDAWALALDVSWEDMSGASPWFVGQNQDAQPQVIMSGPSIRDTRTAVSITTRYYYDRGSAGLNYTRSREDDYDSDAVTFDAAFDSDNGMRTYAGAISVSDDSLKPTQGTTPTNTLEADKDIRSAWLGVTQIVSKRAIVRFGLSYSYRHGYLTDPYKGLDLRPDTRKEWVFDSAYRHFVQGLGGAAQLGYRYYNDSWGLESHTVDLAWQQNMGERAQFSPFVRYYTQSEADFFSNRPDTQGRYFADDHRLSAFGAISLGLRGRYTLGDWSVTVSGERYRTDGSWGIFSGPESPALVNAWRFSFGLEYVYY